MTEFFEEAAERAGSSDDRQARATEPAPAPLHETLWRARDNHRRLQSEVALYIEEMSGALGAMARSAELGLMVYLLDMVRAEAKLQASRPRGNQR